MEDVDEFFEDTEASMANPLAHTTSALSAKKTLGVGRRRHLVFDSRITSTSASRKISIETSGPDNLELYPARQPSPDQVIDNFNDIGENLEEFNNSDSLGSPITDHRDGEKAISTSNEVSQGSSAHKTSASAKKKLSNLSKSIALSKSSPSMPSKTSPFGMPENERPTTTAEATADDVSEVETEFSELGRQDGGTSQLDLNQSADEISLNLDLSVDDEVWREETNFKGSSTVGKNGGSRIIESPLPSPPPEGLRRSKRTKIAPLAFWRNERIIYSRANESRGLDPDSTLVSDIRKVPLQEIKEVVHIPEPLRVKLGKKRGRPSKATEKKRLQQESSAIPKIQGSEWLLESLLESRVFINENDMEERVVAWAPNGGDYVRPPANNEDGVDADNFEVAPLFEIDHDRMAAGVIRIPRDGHKSLRTAGQSLFIFHISTGIVEVTLNSESFIVTTGCSFEVPKLNIYSLKNIGNEVAKLFFVQFQLGETGGSSLEES